MDILCPISFCCLKILFLFYFYLFEQGLFGTFDFAPFFDSDGRLKGVEFICGVKVDYKIPSIKEWVNINF